MGWETHPLQCITFFSCRGGVLPPEKYNQRKADDQWSPLHSLREHPPALERSRSRALVLSSSSEVFHTKRRILRGVKIKSFIQLKGALIIHRHREPPKLRNARFGEPRTAQDDKRGFDICKNFVGAHRVSPLQRQTNFDL